MISLFVWIVSVILVAYHYDRVEMGENILSYLFCLCPGINTLYFLVILFSGRFLGKGVISGYLKELFK